jgi:drug/metabolite transporter (DMT)-like permease
VIVMMLAQTINFGGYMGINTRALAFASGIVAAATFVVCGLMVAVAPGATSSFFGWVFHIDLSSLSRSISVSSFVGGLIVFSAIVGICVAAVAWMYNKLTVPPKLKAA